MAQANSLLKIFAISEYFEESRIIHRGENALSSNHVVNVIFDAELSLIMGSVQASMKNKIYKVELNLDDGKITSSKCECPRGLGKCHHMAALALFAHYNLSATDATCRWNVRQMTKEQSTPITADECFGEPSKSYHLKADDISDDLVDQFRKNLELCLPTSMVWLLQPAPTSDESLLVDIEALILSEDYVSADNKVNFLKNKLRVSTEIIQFVAKATTGQSSNPQWLIAKKHRLTASNFGKVLKACGNKRFPKSLYKTLIGAYHLDHIKQIQWGRNNEKKAIAQFQEKFQVEVVESGLWLHHSGVLGASPDRLIGVDGLIEAKCPFSFKEEDLRECLVINKNYIVSYDPENDQYHVNRDHDYFHQIQGLLHILNRSYCILIIWSLKNMVTVKIVKEDVWAKNLEILENFYYNNYIQYIVNT